MTKSKGAQTREEKYGKGIHRKWGKKGGNPYLKKGFKYSEIKNPL